MLPDRKPEPLMVSVNGPEFTAPDPGERPVIVGAGLVTVKFAVADPPPGDEFVTVIVTVPGV